MKLNYCVWTGDTKETHFFLLPHRTKRLAELGVVQRGSLLGEAPPHGLREHHERVHRPLYMLAPHATAAPVKQTNI